jgi:hypothetical protein
MYKDLIIKTGKKYGLLRNQLAYVLATTELETNYTFEPVREAYYLGDEAEAYRKKLRYYPWYGRGFVQLTWEDNYKKAGKRLGIDLTTNPDKAMDPEIAAEVLVVGMMEGWFTGKKLSDYITLQRSDFLNARRIVNGMDRAKDIESLAKKWDRELLDAGYGVESTEKPVDGSKDKSGVPAWIITVIGLLGLLWTFIQGRINK